MKNALAGYINAEEIIDSDFMIGKAFIHLKSNSAKKKLLSVSPVVVSTNNKNSNESRAHTSNSEPKAPYISDSNRKSTPKSANDSDSLEYDDWDGRKLPVIHISMNTQILGSYYPRYSF